MSPRAINWFLQRVTGAALLVLLILHFWVEHFTAEVRTHGLTFEAIQKRFFANPWFVAVDITFLIVATYHGLNGVRNIICDFGRITKPVRIGVTVVLIGLGVLLTVWGIGAFYGNKNFNPMNPKQAMNHEATKGTKTFSVILSGAKNLRNPTHGPDSSLRSE